MITIRKKIEEKVLLYSVNIFLLMLSLMPLVSFAESDLTGEGRDPDLTGEGPDPDLTGSGGGGGEFAKLKNPLEGTVDSIPDFIKELLDIVVLVGVPVVAIMIIISGLRFVTASGNPEKLTKARDGLLWTLVGAAIVLGAYALAEAIGSTVKDLTNI